MAHPRPDGDGYMVTHYNESGREVHQFIHTAASEKAPHGAGSYHDPMQHRELLERHETYLRGLDR